jgi:hypothetical protein
MRTQSLQATTRDHRGRVGRPTMTTCGDLAPIPLLLSSSFFACCRAAPLTSAT